MGWIYKITNQVNGKMYIGKTEDSDPEERWKQHQHDYKRRKMEKRPLYDAMNKYGFDNFIFQVIDEENDSEKLCQLERHYIEKYRTYIGFDDCNGYNTKTLRIVANQNWKSSRAYGYDWFRLNEIPEEYKPLLDLYYKNINDKKEDRNKFYIEDKV